MDRKILVILGKRMKEYSPKTHGVALIAALFFAILLASCEQPKKSAAPSAKTATTATVATAETTTTPPKLNTEGNDKTPSPTATDIAALSNAMHGAASQQPDYAPKDQYGNPYIIGDLGGVPVNLSSATVELLEYNDSPGFNIEKARNYHPPKRNYQSVIKSFGFWFRERDMQLYDRNNIRIVNEFNIAEDTPKDNDWVSVSVSSGSSYGTAPYPYDIGLKNDTEYPSVADIPYHFPGERQYGLDLYTVPGINRDTGVLWRESPRAQDIFVKYSSDGHIETYIRCSNSKVPSPPCDHSFIFPKTMRIRVSLYYNRHLLHKWQAIQEKAQNLILGFKL